MHIPNRTIHPKNLQRWVALVSCTAALAACGGGGGGAAPTRVSPSVAMQGFWFGSIAPASDGATRASSVIMPDGTAWVVFEGQTTANAVARVVLSGTGLNETDASVSGAGAYYRLSDGAKVAVSVSGTASTAGTLKGTAIVTGNANTTINWNSVAGFTTPAQQADVAATWNGTAGAGAVHITWTISAAGALSGNSSTGCTYSGTLTPNAGIAVYKVAVSEDCAGTVKTVAGIATLAAAKTSLRVVYTANAEASGGLISFTK